ncbi:hypothetical protein KIW84_054341 [Lathyrus oleraceus]|uniref:Retrovirus-related Pol polyprotein from transposon TNT 1-94-like beta-barrel domain-containing protein n=1 Tax=Pisum sativum TaxID=3888 RepID=A0A9D4WSU3_PEA|nr:hypothetical protein KIW84_054341 [Pisum sativum]
MAAESGNFTAPCVPKFDGDYDHWSLVMENLMRSKEYWCVIQDEGDCKIIVGVNENQVPGKCTSEVCPTAGVSKDFRNVGDEDGRIVSKDIDQLTVDELQSLLLVHEQKVCHNKSEEQVLKVEHDSYFVHGRGRNNYPRGGSNNSRGRGRTRPGNKGWFCEINESFRHTVKLGNNSKLAVMGKGNFRFEVEGITQLISDVFFVPELSSNLKSIGQLQEKGVDVRIKGGMCKVYHPQRGLIMNTRMTVNQLFIVFAFRKPLSSKCMKVEGGEVENLWHKPMGI